MKRFYISILFLMFSTLEVRADAEAVVIEVRKSVSLSKTDKVYKNYFINGGSAMGLNKGTTVDVLRRVPFHDPIKNSAIGDIRVKVAELEIIHSDAKLSVGKLVFTESAEHRPVVDFDAVMIGDRLDLDTIRTPLVTQVTVDPALEAQGANKDRAPASLGVKSAKKSKNSKKATLKK